MVPSEVSLAVIGIFILVAEHVFALATPPYGIHIPLFFHSIFGLSYLFLALQIQQGKAWALITFTVLVATQCIGRIFVFIAEDRKHKVIWRMLLVIGFLLSVGVLALLWSPETSRQFFFPS